MPIKSRDSIHIPQVSAPTWLFKSPNEPLPDQPIIIDAARPDTHFLTLSTYRSLSQRLAKGLREAGLKSGDHVQSISLNSLAYPIFAMGVWMAGGSFSGCPPLYPTEKINHMVEEASPAFIMAGPEGLEKAKIAAAAIGVDSSRIFVFEAETLFAKADLTNGHVPQGHRHWQELLAAPADDFDWTSYASSDDTAIVMYTSGSEGPAKGIQTTHYNMISGATQFIEMDRRHPRSHENSETEKWIMWLPLYHAVGLSQTCLILPKRGGQAILMRSLDLEPVLKYTEQFRATVMVSIPPLMVKTMHHQALKNYDLSSLRALMTGGPLRASLSEQFRKRMGIKDLRIWQAFGMTEMTINSFNTDLTQPDIPGCSGKLLPNCEAKIMTLDGERELGPNEQGELWVRAPNVCTRGYLKRPEQTKETFQPGGWLRTGDLGYYDADENWWILDRIKQLIHTADGQYACPTDMESMLLEVPGVKDAALTTIDDPNSTRKIPRGYVVLDETTSVSTEDVTSAYNAMAQPHQHIVGGIQAIPMVPRLPGAKFDKEAIKAIDAEIRLKSLVQEAATYASDHERYLSYMRAIEETLLRMYYAFDTRQWHLLVPRVFADQVTVDYSLLFGWPARTNSAAEHAVEWEALAKDVVTSHHLITGFLPLSINWPCDGPTALDREQITMHANMQVYLKKRTASGNEVDTLSRGRAEFVMQKKVVDGVVEWRMRALKAFPGYERGAKEYFEAV